MTKLERELEASVVQTRSLAVVPQAGAAMTRQSPQSAWAELREQAKTLVDSGFLPRAINTPEKAMAVIQTGRELGLQPMQSIRSIHIIEGKPTMSADLIAGLALSKHPGGKLRVTESTNDRCVVEAARSGQEPTVFEFTIGDARNAGLAGKDVWKKYTRAMLRARCLTEASRAIFPDIVAGIYDPDEIGGGADLTDAAWQHVEEVRPQRATPDISPHLQDGESFDDPAPESNKYEEITQQLQAAFDKILPLFRVEQQSGRTLLHVIDGYDAAKHYDTVLAVRALIGSKAQQSELTKQIQRAREAGELNAQQHADIGKRWAHVSRNLEKLEALKPDAVAAFADPDDDADPENFDRSL